MIKIARTSQITGKRHEMWLPVTQEQLDRYYTGQELIQDIFPNLNPDQREFIMTGITPDEWSNTFLEEDDDYYDDPDYSDQ